MYEVLPLISTGKSLVKIEVHCNILQLVLQRPTGKRIHAMYFLVEQKHFKHHVHVDLHVALYVRSTEKI